MSKNDFYRGVPVAVTGAAGTVGKALVKSLLEQDVKCVFALDNDEGSLFDLTEALRGESRLEAFLADVADISTLRYFFSGVDYVFHAAAYKNVPVIFAREPGQAGTVHILRQGGEPDQRYGHNQAHG